MQLQCWKYSFFQAAEHYLSVLSGVLVQSFSFDFTFMNAVLLSVMGWLKLTNFCDLSCVILKPTVQWETVFHTTHCTPVCNPHLFLFFFFLLNLQIYMNAVWHGWAIPMFLFLAILRLSLNYLIARYLLKY